MIYDENGKARIDRNGRKPIHLHAVAEKMSIPMHNTEVDCICCGRKQKLHLFPGGKGFYCPACHVSGNDILFYLMNKTGQEPAILMEMLINGTLDERAVVDKFYKDMGSEGKIPFAVKTIQVKKVDVDNVELSERNLTYNAFLNKLKISTEHERNLIERGLRRSDIIANNYKTVPKIGFSKIAADLRKESYNLEGVPGFFKKDGLWSVKKTLPGFFIPARDIPDPGQIYGNIQGMQIRFDVVSPDDTRYKWFSTGGFENGSAASTYAHVSGNPDNSQYCILTEGPLKADIIHRFLGHCVVAVPGVGSQRNLQEMLPVLHKRGIRVFYMAFDMDYKKNFNVMSSYTKMVKMLCEHGFRTERFLWDENYKGLDDWLLHVFLERGGKLDYPEK